MSNTQEHFIFYEKYSKFPFAQDRRKACAGSDKQVGPFFLLMTIDDDDDDDDDCDDDDSEADDDDDDDANPS